MTVTNLGGQTDSNSTATIDWVVPVGGIASGVTLLILCTSGRSARTLSSMTDDGGTPNTYTRDGQVASTQASAGVFRSKIANALAAGKKITLTLSGTTTSKSVTVLSVDNARVAPLDGSVATNSGTGDGTTVTVTLGAATAQGDELIVGAAAMNSATGAWIPPNGWSEDQDAQVSIGTHTAGHLALTSIATPTFNPVSGAGSVNWAALVAAYKLLPLLSAGTGSFALTGVAAGLKAARKIAAAAGSYALTGVAAGLKAARKITAAVGSFTLSGQAAGIRAARTIAAGAGVYIVTGIAAGLTSARKMSAAAGGYVLTGQAAGLGSGRRLSAAAGSYALAGIDAAFPVQRRMAADPGAYVLDGQDAALSGPPPPAAPVLGRIPEDRQNRTAPARPTTRQQTRPTTRTDLRRRP